MTNLSQGTGHVFTGIGGRNAEGGVITEAEWWTAIAVIQAGFVTSALVTNIADRTQHIFAGIIAVDAHA